jgi:hypothetical protein
MVKYLCMQKFCHYTEKTDKMNKIIPITLCLKKKFTLLSFCIPYSTFTSFFKNVRKNY